MSINSYDSQRVARAIDAAADAARAEVLARAVGIPTVVQRRPLQILAADVHDAAVRAAVDVLRDVDDEAAPVPSATSIRAATLNYFHDGPGRETLEQAKLDLARAKRGRR